MSESFPLSEPAALDTDIQVGTSAPGDQFLRRVRQSATTVLGDSQTGREVLELCEEHAEARRMILQDRSAGATVIAVVGATGQGKSWLIQQLVRRSPIAASIPSGNNLDQATEKLVWIGPRAPADLDSRHERFLHCDNASMEPIGVPYLIVDAPGATDDRRGIVAVASRALSLASVLLLVVRRDQIRAETVSAIAHASEGTIVVPVINAIRQHDAQLSADVDSLAAHLRHAAPASVVVNPILVDDFDLASRDEQSVGADAARRIAEALQMQLGSSWEGDRRKSTRLAALDGRFRAALSNLLEGQLPGLTHAVGRLNAEATKLPGEVAETLIGTSGPMRAAIRSRLRLSLLSQTAALWFPYRTQLGLLNLTHGAWDRVLLSLSGSLPSLVSTVWSSTKQLTSDRNANEEMRDGLQRRGKAAVTDRLGPLAARFREELLMLQNRGGQVVRSSDAPAVSQLAYLSGIDALQEASQEIFDSETDRVAISRGGAIFAALLGTLVFWSIMAGPIVSLYREYFEASYSTLTGSGATLETFPKPEFALILTSLILSILPTAVIAMFAISSAQSSGRVRRAEESIRRRHHESIEHLQRNGVLQLRWDDPLLADAEFLVSAGTENRTENRTESQQPPDHSADQPMERT